MSGVYVGIFLPYPWLLGITLFGDFHALLFYIRHFDTDHVDLETRQGKYKRDKEGLDALTHTRLK